MEKREFRAESKRLLDLMINSIYTNKEIFLRELISNASDAIDKMYYVALTDHNMTFNKDDYFIEIKVNKDERSLCISDTGIGMTKEELEDNLGIIANSGSFNFKKNNELKDGFDIIGQFGVGFYSAFMVADKVTVISMAQGESKAYRWESEGADGYTIEETEKEYTGTEIILKIKENTEEENYDEFLEEYRIKSIIKKYSDFIRYPIKMEVTDYRPKEDTEGDFEEVREVQIINSMVPIWRKNKNDLTDEDYENFYAEKHFGFDKPIKHVHMNVDGLIRFNSIFFIPGELPYDFYTKEYEKGLQLYSSGVLIMNKCADLLPDYFSFVKGVVDSEDLSLNISREMLQHNRQLKTIAKRIKDKIKDELLLLLKDDRESYKKFFENFGRQLKYGIYSDFGMEKDVLEDLILFYSSKEKKPVTLAEYIERMAKGQEHIYYQSGESYDRIDKLPQVEFMKDKGYEILYFTDDVDEFAIKVLGKYKDKEFKSVSSSDLKLDDDKEDEQKEDNKDMLKSMKDILGDKVKDVRLTRRLKDHPVYLAAEGELSIEMEKVLSQMPGNPSLKADKILEINENHKIYERLRSAFENDKDKIELYTNLLYNQALLMEGLPIEDPVEFTNNIWKLL